MAAPICVSRVASVYAARPQTVLPHYVQLSHGCLCLRPHTSATATDSNLVWTTKCLALVPRPLPCSFHLLALSALRLALMIMPCAGDDHVMCWSAHHPTARSTALRMPSSQMAWPHAPLVWYCRCGTTSSTASTTGVVLPAVRSASCLTHRL